MNKLPEMGELVQFNEKVPEISPYIGAGKFVIVLKVVPSAEVVEVGNPLTLKLIVAHDSLRTKIGRPLLIHVSYLVGYDNV